MITRRRSIELLSAGLGVDTFRVYTNRSSSNMQHLPLAPHSTTLAASERDLIHRNGKSSRRHSHRPIARPPDSSLGR